MAKFSNIKYMLSKIETVQGTDSVPTVANGILGRNYTWSPMEGGEDERDIERPFFGAQQKFVQGLYGKLAVSVDAVGGLTAGTAPQWSSLARACGLGQTVNVGTSVVYAPVSPCPDSTSIYFGIDGLRQRLLGSKGNLMLNFMNQKLPTLDFEMWGQWEKPSDTANVVPTNFASFAAPQMGSQAFTPVFTVGGQTLNLRDFTLNVGHEPKLRLLQNFEEIQISDRNASVSFQVEVPALSTFDPFNLANTAATTAIVFTHGVGAGKVLSVSIPRAAIKKPPAPVVVDNILEYNLTADLIPSNTGNDEFTITLT